MLLRQWQSLDHNLTGPEFSGKQITFKLRSITPGSARAMKLGAVYEPEQFPAAILHFEEPKVTVQFFASGKAVIAGAKDLEDLNRTVSLASELLFSQT